MYDKTAEKAADLLQNYGDKTYESEGLDMPSITDPDLTLRDIYHKTSNSEVIAWVYEQANLKQTS